MYNMDMLTIIEIEGREDGFHGLQSQSGRKECWLEGWVEVPPELVATVNNCGGYCDLEMDDTGALIGVTPRERPAPPEPTPAEKREAAYNTEKIIDWEGEQLTVTEAAQLWQYYSAEGDSEKAEALTALISEAKQAIREKYPDE